ncbi:DNA polymerase III subunit beta [Candidatus Viridilinea mediisalina]|uniref:DNA polymerase III subunit beta n=2 Tax=Candidatus Viridilinea mediisalina TaxID=2024553 RepID=A0A2A6RPJ0_9CHLR|nr:DNA polymerase III subunit beta [Candidatus Viridilinea mediisalina]
MATKPSLETIILRLQQLMPEIISEYSVKKIFVFGSYARHEQRDDSDLDLLVTFYTKPGLLKYIALEQYLSDMLGIPVDLVMESALRPEVATHVYADLIHV